MVWDIEKAFPFLCGLKALKCSENTSSAGVSVGGAGGI